MSYKFENKDVKKAVTSIVIGVVILGAVGSVGWFLNKKINNLSAKMSLGPDVPVSAKNNPKDSDIVNQKLDQIIKKTSMPDNIWQFNNVKFYVPNYPLDIVQKHIVNKNDFFEGDLLRKLDEYIPENAVILDIGANIGNHTVYWGIQNKIKRIYSYEPIPETYEILKKNIELNNLASKVERFNFAISSENSTAKIKNFEESNIGKTSIELGSGNIKTEKLDNVKITEGKVDLVKIDIEGHEVELFKGASNFISKYKPTIFVESFKDKIGEVKKILTDAGYVLSDFPVVQHNYLFIHKDNVK